MKQRAIAETRVKSNSASNNEEIVTRYIPMPTSGDNL